MTSIYPLADREPGFGGSEAAGNEKTVDVLGGDIPPAPVPSPVQATNSEFVFGPRQLASLAFVGILIIGLMSAIAYFAGRKNTAPQVTERVIERMIPTPVPQAAPPEAAQVAARPAEVAQTPAATSTTLQSQPAKQVMANTKAEVTSPALNRTYLQLGSVEVGVAEVMVEGLRQRGVPAIVGIGINGKVARVLVGPFVSPEEQQVAQKHVEELGFHPFPRTFTERDLEPQPTTPPPTAAAAPARPVVPTQTQVPAQPTQPAAAAQAPAPPHAQP